jgi:hypothetical protein
MNTMGGYFEIALGRARLTMNAECSVAVVQALVRRVDGGARSTPQLARLQNRRSLGTKRIRRHKLGSNHLRDTDGQGTSREQQIRRMVYGERQ